MSLSLVGSVLSIFFVLTLLFFGYAFFASRSNDHTNQYITNMIRLPWDCVNLPKMPKKKIDSASISEEQTGENLRLRSTSRNQSSSSGSAFDSLADLRHQNELRTRDAKMQYLLRQKNKKGNSRERRAFLSKAIAAVKTKINTFGDGDLDMKEIRTLYAHLGDSDEVKRWFYGGISDEFVKSRDMSEIYQSAAALQFLIEKLTDYLMRKTTTYETKSEILSDETHARMLADVYVTDRLHGSTAEKTLEVSENTVADLKEEAIQRFKGLLRKKDQKPTDIGLFWSGFSNRFPPGHGTKPEIEAWSDQHNLFTDCTAAINTIYSTGMKEVVPSVIKNFDANLIGKAKNPLWTNWSSSFALNLFDSCRPEYGNGLGEAVRIVTLIENIFFAEGDYSFEKSYLFETELPMILELAEKWHFSRKVELLILSGHRKCDKIRELIEKKYPEKFAKVECHEPDVVSIKNKNPMERLTELANLYWK